MGARHSGREAALACLEQALAFTAVDSAGAGTREVGFDVGGGKT